MKHCEGNKRIDNYGVLKHRCERAEGHEGWCRCECGEQWLDLYFAAKKAIAASDNLWNGRV